MKKEEWRLAAKKELEEWYRHHNELIQKTKEANRFVVSNVFVILLFMYNVYISNLFGILVFKALNSVII